MATTTTASQSGADGRGPIRATARAGSSPSGPRLTFPPPASTADVIAIRVTLPIERNVTDLIGWSPRAGEPSWLSLVAVLRADRLAITAGLRRVGLDARTRSSWAIIDGCAIGRGAVLPRSPVERADTGGRHQQVDGGFAAWGACGLPR
jgi:hypothetical protein